MSEGANGNYCIYGVIWYATNIEIYDYIAAYKQLIFTSNGGKVYNPTNTTVYFLRNEEEICVKPGETVSIAV